MKKTLNVVLAVILAVAMIASFAYVATPEKSNDYQLSLVSAKAVNVQDTATGVRSYADLVDTDRIYQVNEVIYLAITTEVKNLEKYPKLKSIEGKTIEVIVGSPSIDLSYSKLTHPTLLGNVWSGYTAVNVATVGYLSPAGTMLKYDKNANEITYKFRGVEMYGMGGSAAHNSDYMHLVTFDPKYNSSKEWIEIPAIKLKNKTASWVLGGQTFDAKYEAPDAIAYTMVLTGVTKDNNGAQKGTFYAKLLISGAEKFEDHSQYYLVGYEGRYAATASAAVALWHKYYDADVKNGLIKYSEPKEWRDYVKVDVDILEIAGGYTVYKYFIPSSAVMNFVDFEYDGELAAQNGNDGHGTMADYGIRLGSANPNLFDNATNQSKKMGEDLIDVAGGVRSVKAYETYADYKAGNAKKEFPLTSVVYVNNAPIYAPGFYGGIINWGGQDTEAGGTKNGVIKAEATELTTDQSKYLSQATKYVLELTADQASNFQGSWIKVVPSDAIASLSGDATTGYSTNGGVAWAKNVAPGMDLYGLSRGEYNADYPTTTIGGGPAGVIGTVAGIKELYGVDGRAWGIVARGLKYNAADVMLDCNGAANINTMGVTVRNGKYYVELYVDPNGPLANYTNVFSSKTKVANSLFVYYEEDTVNSLGTLDIDNTTMTPLTGTVPKTDQIFVDPRIVPVVTTGSGSNFILPVGARFDGIDAYYKPFTQVKGDVMKDVKVSGFRVPITAGSLGGGITLKDTSQLLDVRMNIVLTASQTTSAIASGFFSTAAGVSASPVSITVPIHDLRSGLPTNSAAAGMRTLDTSALAVWAANSTAFNNANAVNGTAGARYVLGFTNAEVINDGADKVVYVSGLVIFDKTNPSAGWVQDAPTALFDLLNTAVNTFNTARAGATDPARLSYAVVADYTHWTEAATTGGPYYWYLSNIDAASKAAPERLWETGSESIVVDHNGIVFYSIQSFEDEIPKIGIASEKTYFDSEDGYGICLFDGMSNAYGVQFIGQRIYRSNDSNLAYSRRQTHVEDSSSKIAALRYFDLDTSFNTIWKVLPEQFEAKGAAAVYSEAIEGEFKYGVITIVPDPLDEGAETSEAPMDEESEAPEESEEVTEDVSEDVEEDTPEPTEKAQPVPPTGDASVNVAIALAAAAVVAAAGLAFVMKKVR